jgi:glycosyltransferase involved in cell wall biosynthesis
VGDAVTTERLRVLVLSPFPPRLDGRHGGSRAVAQLVAGLAVRHTIGLLVLRDHVEPGVDDELRAACDLVVEVQIPPVGSSLRARIANRLRMLAALVRGVPSWAVERRASAFAARLEETLEKWRPDIVQLEYRIMGQYLPAVRARSLPCVLVDPDPDGPETVPSSFLAPAERRAWASLGRAVSEQVDSLVVFTERDRRAVSTLSPGTRVVCIPLAYDLWDRPFDPAGAHGHRVLCVGSFVHPPNADAASRLARDIFPAVKARVPDATLELVGSHATPEVHALAGDGITVHADVPDVRPHLDAAAVLAVPVRSGGGMRVKVLEGLAAGKAIVATSLALEGLDVQDREAVRIADTDEQFVEAVVELLTFVEVRTALARAGRQWAEQHLDMDAQVRAYEALYASLPAAQTQPVPGRSA